jgi:hypothetical protein
MVGQQADTLGDWDEVTLEKHADVASGVTFDLPDPPRTRVGRSGVIEDRDPRRTGVRMRPWLYAEASDHCDGGDAGLLHHLADDRLFERLVRFDPSGRHLRAGLGEVHVVEHQDLIAARQVDRDPDTDLAHAAS